MSKKNYVIGVDYGTDSVRSIIVDANNGKEISSSVHYYKRWAKGEFCDPKNNQFRQHPLDYIEGLEKTIKEAIKGAPKGAAESIKGISVDTTGSTPCAVDKDGTPLALTKGFENNPNAMFVLWKDHTSVKEADEINKVARTWGGEDYTKYVGGVYSSEWFWAKILHILRNDKKVKSNAFSWVEHCDWIPALLVGDTNPLTIKRSRCAAGHKAMWHADFEGLPSEKFLIKIDPLLKGLREKLYDDTYTSDIKVGNLCKEWAKKLGLSENVAIGVGAFDAHMGAIGGEIRPYALTKIMGTSTCDILIAPTKKVGNKLIKGICGQVDGSVIPNMLGMEAGQSAFGDIYAWFKNVLSWPLINILPNIKSLTKEQKQKAQEEITNSIIAKLDQAASKLELTENDSISIDWMNGRRTPYANQLLKGAITGLNLGSDAPAIYKSLVESTAFGAKKIVDRFIEEGIPIKSVIALGGVAKKSPYIMQVVSDVLDMKISVSKSEQTCALGAAMCAAAVAGIYPSVEDARDAMTSGFEKEYVPNIAKAKIYKKLYQRYTKISEFIEKDTMEEAK